MKIKVEAFASAKDLFGFKEKYFDIPDGASLQDTITFLSAKFPDANDLLDISSYAVNSEYSSLDNILKDGDTISILPPVSGGQENVRIYEKDLEVNEVINFVSSPSAGAISIFIGTVRNENQGHKVSSIYYEAKKDMVATEVDKILFEAKKKFSINKTFISIRIGELKIGEASVIIGVSAGHRKDAYDANEWILEELKKRAPIWKYETRTDEGKEIRVWLEQS
ncbi:MAG: hypothetical protein AUJ18_08635 [Candidatus Hydrogenedentes bacterium CG1_02_42_14]|nr:MAG: hypothetical protein AUJ18_08635 [Candidatus Hydrogenedentes bacterium CG1_02_42_14]